MPDGTLDEGYDRAARMIRSARAMVVFTGAGISTESGIPDFRSPGGIWATSTPVLFEQFLADADARKEYWRQKAVAHRDFVGSQPNAGHRVLAKWESAGRIGGVITQNIDELHQQAGSIAVLELHGTARKVSCLECKRQWPAGPFNEQYLADSRVPVCNYCGGWLKHATVSFGQQLPPEILMQAAQWSRRADLFLAIGSSLVVEPAAGLPRLACERGARLIIFNRDPTPLDYLAALSVCTSIGLALSAIDAILSS